MGNLPIGIDLEIRQVLARSTVRGSDPVRALLERGHLWYPDRQREIQAGTLRQAADLLGEISIRPWRTVTDARLGVQEWLRQQADQMEGK